MNIIGYKNCPNCNSKACLSNKMILTLNNRPLMCESCGKNYSYSNKRRLIATILSLGILFIPTIILFENLDYMINNSHSISDYIYLEYLVAIFVFYGISGNTCTNNA